MAKAVLCRNILLRTGFGRDADGSCTPILLQLHQGPGGVGTTLSDFKGRAPHNEHLLGVSCLFPELIPHIVVQGPGLQLLRSCHGLRAAEGRIFLQELAIKVGFITLKLRETCASPVVGEA